jgi:hypothetical protein
MGYKGGISKDIPDEYHWWDIDWIIFGCKPILVLKCPLLYITPARLNSLSTITMQIMLIRNPIGPLLILEDGLNPKIGSALLANSSSISPMDFMIIT